jgi:hypothetical protein
MIYRILGSLAIVWSGSSPTPLKSLACQQVVWERGAKSYKGEKAWFSINHNILCFHYQTMPYFPPRFICIINSREWIQSVCYYRLLELTHGNFSHFKNNTFLFSQWSMTFSCGKISTKESTSRMKGHQKGKWKKTLKGLPAVPKLARFESSTKCLLKICFLSWFAISFTKVHAA